MGTLRADTQTSSATQRPQFQGPDHRAPGPDEEDEAVFEAVFRRAVGLTTQLRPPRKAAVGSGVRPKPKRRNAHRGPIGTRCVVVSAL